MEQKEIIRKNILDILDGESMRAASLRIGMDEKAIERVVKSNNPTIAKILEVAQGLGRTVNDIVYPKNSLRLASDNKAPIDKELLLNIAEAFDEALDEYGDDIIPNNRKIQAIIEIYLLCAEKKVKRISPESVLLYSENSK